MAYRTDFRISARRHFRAASELLENGTSGAQPGCTAVAGYLFGLCGELAVKAMMSDSGMKPLADGMRREDPYFAHFPELKGRLKDAVSGRRAGELRKIAESAALFENWDTDMRYARTNDVQGAWVLAWASSAKELLIRMDVP